MTVPGNRADAALAALRGPAAVGRPPVTTLSVDEAVLLDQRGMHPLGLVCGASVVQVAAFARLAVGYSDNGEMTHLSQALETSRETAVNRLGHAAGELGAAGVVGVAIDLGDLSGTSNLVRLVVTGTAVGSAAHRLGRPWTAALSGQEVHLLDRAGYQPLGIVSGVCAYHVGRRSFSAWSNSVTVNQEMTIYTQALSDARELAMGRLQEAALRLGADGVVGVAITERSGVWGSHVIEFAALGTAVRSSGEHVALDPRLVIDLSGN